MGVVNMKLASEDIVTKLLINREIIKWQDAPEVFDKIPQYNNGSNYDLTEFLNSQPIEKQPKEQKRFGDKYLFVK